MMQSENINEISEALAIAQTEVKNPVKNKTARIVKKDGSGAFTYKYADIADVLDCVRPVLSKHGLSITQPTAIADGMIILRTRIAHKSGQWIESEYPVCTLGNGDHKTMGAAMTMARRYALTSLVGVASDDDTDGEGAEAAMQNGKKAARGPDWGKANQARNRGDWDAFMAALKDCQSAHEVDRLEHEYQETRYKDWSQGWQEKAAEEFAKYRSDFKEPGEALTLREQLEGSLDETKPDPEHSGLATRAEYIQSAHDYIETLTTEDDVNEWWDKSAPGRKRFRLTPAEETDLKARAKARIKAIRGADTFVPNARERAIKDKAGVELHPLDAG